MQWLSLLQSEIATGQTAVLRVNFAPSADQMWISDWLFLILPFSWGALTYLPKRGLLYACIDISIG